MCNMIFKLYLLDIKKYLVLDDYFIIGYQKLLLISNINRYNSINDHCKWNNNLRILSIFIWQTFGRSWSKSRWWNTSLTLFIDTQVIYSNLKVLILNWRHRLIWTEKVSNNFCYLDFFRDVSFIPGVSFQWVQRISHLERFFH